jgi:hypothetical protein
MGGARMIHSCPHCDEVYETKDLLNYVHKQLHEQTIAERDARIKELEALVEKLKCCDNCKHENLDHKEHPCNMCDETDDRWEA